jgi:hypothetical protein
MQLMNQQRRGLVRRSIIFHDATGRPLNVDPSILLSLLPMVHHFGSLSSGQLFAKGFVRTSLGVQTGLFRFGTLSSVVSMVISIISRSKSTGDPPTAAIADLLHFEMHSTNHQKAQEVFSCLSELAQRCHSRPLAMLLTKFMLQYGYLLGQSADAFILQSLVFSLIMMLPATDDEIHAGIRQILRARPEFPDELADMPSPDPHVFRTVQSAAANLVNGGNFLLVRPFVNRTPPMAVAPQFVARRGPRGFVRPRSGFRGFRGFRGRGVVAANQLASALENMVKEQVENMFEASDDDWFG